MKLLIAISLLLLSGVITAQELRQNIRGRVIDETTGFALSGVNVIITTVEPFTGTITDEKGNFEFIQVPVGRHSLSFSFVGFEKRMVNNLLLTSAKEIVVEVSMTEQVTSIEEIVVKAGRGKENALNEMAMVSARSFSVEETERFAGSLGDPARMVANYAGVMTQNDSRNDIIIRGNSPIGVQWRLEDMEIPNPNHFGALGTTGGPVSMLNNNLLSNSDFLTGAFPAQYGNVLSGVFDLNMRSGNSHTHEFMGQIGFNGFELGGEGPLWKAKNGQNPSYMANFRYSTLDVMHKIGFDVGTGAAVPQYKDLTFIVDLPGTKAGRFQLIGLWGESFIELGRESSDTTGNSYTARNTATDFGSELGFLGLNHTWYLNEKSRFRTTLSVQYMQSTTKYDSVYTRQERTVPVFRSSQYEGKASFTTEFKQKVDTRNNFSVGLIADHYFLNFADSFMNADRGFFIKTVDSDGSIDMLRGYAQWQHNFSNRLTGYAGFYSHWFGLNNEVSFEPRASLQWRISTTQTLTAGYGNHSQVQPKSVYLFRTYNDDDGTYNSPNTDIESTKSNHFVVGYQHMLTPNWRIKLETYYQQLYNIPIIGEPTTDFGRQFSMVNAGDNFYITQVSGLVNDGIGENRGVELTIEKFLAKGFYFLFTSSLFDSKYRDGAGVWRSTAFDGGYVFNLLGGYEKRLSQKTMLTFDVKSVLAGGRHYIPIDVDASIASGEEERDYSRAWDDRYDDYFRTDVRIGIKLNGKKTSQEWAIDLQNITSYQSIFNEGFDFEKGEVYRVYQQGFYPMFLYRINF